MVFLPCVFPFLLPPLIVGGYLLSRLSSWPLQRFVALLTLKPLFATPLWLALLELSVQPSWAHPIPDTLLHALPGISLTIFIVWVCRASLKAQSAGLIATLLVLDTIRWGSTVLSQAANRPYGTEGLGILSVTMPSVFAIVAWRASRKIHEPIDIGDRSQAVHTQHDSKL